jgi:hypothetical protein
MVHRATSSVTRHVSREDAMRPDVAHENLSSVFCVGFINSFRNELATPARASRGHLKPDQEMMLNPANVDVLARELRTVLEDAEPVTL